MSSYNRKIKLRRDNLANFTTHNPVLASGEPAIAFRPDTASSNTKQSAQALLKIGDGTNNFLNLPHMLSNHDVQVYKHTVNVPAVPANSGATITIAENASTYLNDGDSYATYVTTGSGLPHNLHISHASYDYTNTGSEISVRIGNHGTSPSNTANDVDLYVMLVQAAQGSSVVTTTPAPAIALAHKEMFATGRNQFGQLGLDDTTNRNILTRLEPYSATYWKQVDGGMDHAVALSNADEMYTTGSNYYGQLGLNELTNVKKKKFTKVANVYTSSGVYDNNPTFTKVSAGSHHTAGINASGELFVCGNNSYGALGDGTVNNSSKFNLVGDGTKYRGLVETANIQYDGSGNISLVDASEPYTGPKAYVIQTSGSYSFTSSTYPFAVINSGLATTGGSYTLNYTGASEDSTNSVLGTNYKFYTGNITLTYNGTDLPDSGLLVAIKDGSNIVTDSFLFDENINGSWSDVSCGQYHTLGVKKQRAYGWGHNYFGQAGADLTNVVLTPRIMNATTSVERVVAGEYHSLILESGVGIAGKLWTIGLNDRGQLGRGDRTNRTVFDGASHAMTGITHAAAGRKHTVAVSGDNLYAFGDDTYGQLGVTTDDSTKRAESPVLTSLTNVQKVAAGSNHTIALDSFYRLNVFGRNNDGQLGLSDTSNKNIPTIINDQTDYLSTEEGTYRYDSPGAGGNSTYAFRFDYLPSVVNSITFTQNTNYDAFGSNNGTFGVNRDRITNLTFSHTGLEENVTSYKITVWRKTGSGSSLPAEPRVISTGTTDNDYKSYRAISKTPTSTELGNGVFIVEDIYLEEPSTTGDYEYEIFIWGVNSVGTGPATKSTTITVTKS
jgi:alpha-tubulin suppressor-like RCC1 family protein